MSSLIQPHKFLLDENVRRELSAYLKRNNFDVSLALKAATDQRLAIVSKTDKRILITNDEDFTLYTSDRVFSVIWLRIPQGDSQALVSSFEKLMQEISSFSGKLIVLEEKRWQELPLGKELKVEK